MRYKDEIRSEYEKKRFRISLVYCITFRSLTSDLPLACFRIRRCYLLLIGLAFLAGQVEAQIDANLSDIILVQDGKIYFHLGYNQGIHEGMHFQIYRVNPNEKLFKLARLIVIETFDHLSKGVLIEEDIGVEVKVGDRVEILPELEQEETEAIKSSEDLIIPTRPQVKKTSRRWSWLIFGGGVVTSGLAIRSRNALADAHKEYDVAGSQFNDAKTLPDSDKFLADIEKQRDDGNAFRRQYYIFAAVSVGLLGYAGYKLFLNRASADNMNAIPPSTIFPEFTSNHIGVTFQKQW